ncbi:hypothetical protein [Segatella oulorum]|uniref:hypothetical protein n=1 Tax=Segatella oulorum TaxID=28136 RepID=UPI0028EFA283|nr:hypothetical protein [Segatella oulorum]
MSYEERIEWFWGRVQALRLDGYQIAMWFGLLKLFKDAGFPTRCEVENECLCNLLGMEIRTLRAVRKRLIENNLIAYEAGNAKKQPAYIIDMELYASMHPAKEIVKPQQQAKSKPKPKRVQEVVEPVLFKEEKKKMLPKKVEQASPTLEEVIKICTDKGMSEDEARNFFYYYDAQGWVTTGGQKIKRIDSMVNRWLTNGKGKEHDRVNNTNSSKREARNREVIEHVMSHYK